MSVSRIFAPFALGAVVAVSSPAFSQTPTTAQQQAIRSSCVADYRANCSSVPTGGMASLVCLEQHESKLSPSCKSAVEAVDSHSAAPAGASAKTGDNEAAPTTETPEAKSSKPAATAAKPESENTATPKASEASTKPEAANSPPMAPKMSFRGEMRLAAGACARDFRLLCPNLPVGHGNVLFCLKVHGPKLDATCRNALLDAGEVF